MTNPLAYEWPCASNCGLRKTLWPRVRELVAIRDAAVRFVNRYDEIDSGWMKGTGAFQDFHAIIHDEIARQEAERETKTEGSAGKSAEVP
jgi:hypothetical protein